MSLADDRAEFVAALTAVDGITAYAVSPKTPRPGDAWLRWGGAGLDSPNDPLFAQQWSVVVMLPQSEAAADEWIDAHIGAILTALGPVAWVVSYAPATLGGTDNAPVFGLLITATRE